MLILQLVLLLVTGIIGAVISKQINLGTLSIWWALGPSTISGLMWAWMVKTATNLSFIAIVFDVVYTAAFVMGFMMLGERLCFGQLTGLTLALLGVALMAK